MKSYLDIVQNILENGVETPTRTGINAITLPFQHWQFDMSSGKFPLLTTRKMPFQSVRVELEGFCKGVTDKRWFQDRSCKYWDFWANPFAVSQLLMKPEYQQQVAAILAVPLGGSKIERDKAYKSIQKECNDLGAIYGYQWRRWNIPYIDGEPNSSCFEPLWENPIDQLANLVWKLKNKPEDRRMVVFAYQPSQLSQQALPACHTNWTVIPINGVLNLEWIQRSCDFGLGVPSNISSYATLLKILCHTTGYKPGILSASFQNAHVYINQIECLDEQLSREPKELPTLEITLDKDKTIFDWEYNMVRLKDYSPHPAIKFPLVAV